MSALAGRYAIECKLGTERFVHEIETTAKLQHPHLLPFFDSGGADSQWWHDLVRPRVDGVIVCDRRGLRRQGNKGDHLDADDLAEQLRRGGLRPVYHGGHHQALCELTRVPEPRRGYDPGSAPPEGVLPRAGHPDGGDRGL